MPGEYNRATWAFQPIALSHTATNIVAALKSFLLQSGWVLAPWSPTVDNIWLQRADAGMVSVVNNANGTAGNVAITKTGSALTVTGMSAGSSTSPAKGTVLLTKAPADGDTVTISDGTTSKVFEFDTGNAPAVGGVNFTYNPATDDLLTLNDGTNAAITFQFTNGSPAGGNIAVAIAGGVAGTVTNLINAINAQSGSLNIAATAGFATTIVALTNTVNGTVGNQPITFTASTHAFGVMGMSGGGTAGVTSPNVAVSVGPTLLQAADYLIAAINASGLTVTASVTTYRWRYDGDGPEQFCGLHIFNDPTNGQGPAVTMDSYLQTTDGFGPQAETSAGVGSFGQRVVYVYDLTAENDLLFYGGEDCLYYESGRDGNQNTLGHGCIFTIMPIVQFSGTRDLKVKWSAQGWCLDLFGPLKCALTRSYRFVDNNGANKNYSACMRPYVARGSQSVLASSPSNDVYGYLCPRDNLLGVVGGNGDGSGFEYFMSGVATFGLINSPLDNVYKISPFWFIQHVAYTPVSVNDGTLGNLNTPADTGAMQLLEPRWFRMVPRLAATDQTQLPWNNITDDVTGITYRVFQFQDGGRVTNGAIEYPMTSVTIPTTPT